MRRTLWSLVALPLIVSVSGAAPASAAETAAKAEASGKDRFVCRKLEETGSLVKKTKVCLTREQWTRSSENHEKHARDLADGVRTKPAGE